MHDSFVEIEHGFGIQLYNPVHATAVGTALCWFRLSNPAYKKYEGTAYEVFTNIGGPPIDALFKVGRNNGFRCKPFYFLTTRQTCNSRCGSRLSPLFRTRRRTIDWPTTSLKGHRLRCYFALFPASSWPCPCEKVPHSRKIPSGRLTSATRQKLHISIED